MRTNIRGYIVHANCWTLLERVFGGRKTERNLELLLQIFMERFDENPFDIHEYMDYGNGTKPSPFWREPPLIDLVRPRIVFYKSDGNKSAGGINRGLNDKVTRETISLRDPLHIPWLQILISRSEEDGRAKKAYHRPSRERRIRREITFQGRQKVRSSLSPLLARLLIPEIVHLILDHLSRPTDISNAIHTFCWDIPDSYWKHRVPRGVLFELADVCQDDLDWKSFFMAYCTFLVDSPEMKNR